MAQKPQLQGTKRPGVLLGLVFLLLGLIILLALAMAVFPHFFDRNSGGRKLHTVHLMLRPASAPVPTASGLSAVTPKKGQTAAQPPQPSHRTSPAPAIAPVLSGHLKRAPGSRPVPDGSGKLSRTACTETGWYTETGAFGLVSMARSLEEKLRSASFSSCIGTLAGSRLYRVLVGPLPTRNAAEAAAERLQKLKITRAGGYPQYWQPSSS